MTPRERGQGFEQRDFQKRVDRGERRKEQKAQDVRRRRGLLFHECCEKEEQLGEQIDRAAFDDIEAGEAEFFGEESGRESAFVVAHNAGRPAYGVRKAAQRMSAVRVGNKQHAAGR